MVRTDPRLLDRLIENLVSNAIKYTATGKVLLGCRRLGSNLSIQVWDTGIGIPEDKLASIFEEYYQIDNAAMERRRGLGLGLALVQRIAHLLGHALEVRSTYGKGSVFAVTVPLAHTARDARGRPPLMPLAPRTPNPAAAVLLVEDDVAVRESLQIFLGLEGCAVTTAGTAEEALALVADGTVRPVIVIVDRNLPGAMNGPSLVKELARILPEAVPAIVLTGDQSAEAAREIAELGAEHVLKPVAPEKLAVLMQRLLKGRQGGAALPGTAPVPAAATVQQAQSGATIHVVDDDPSVRKAMQALLQRLGYAVETWATAEALLAGHQPRDLECLLVDVSMPGMNGLQLQEALHERRIAAPVIVMTGRQEVPVAVQAMRAGAVDFLEKPVAGERLLEALERALELGARASDAASARAAVESRRARLTPRERQVCDLIVEGLSTKEVAARLGISPRTVENQRARVMEKMGAGSLAALVRTALSADPAGLDLAIPSKGAVP